MACRTSHGLRPTEASRAGGTRTRERLCYQLDSCEDGSCLDVDRLFFILNAHFESQWVKLPPLAPERSWYRAIDTSLPGGEDFAEPGKEIRIDPSDHYIANPRSTVVLLAH